MKSIYAYLSFTGNCREAMEFYQKCLGGELTFQTIGETPLSEKLSSKMKKHILHAELSNNNFVLMGSDIVREKCFIQGNAFSLVLNCMNENELRSCYKKLSYGGEQTMQIELNYWGALIGELKDKFGNIWILRYHKTN